MTLPCQSDPALEHFSGLAPLFPLPGVVLFPHGLLPLHIFEPRYRQMTADALEGEQLIAMSLLKPDWQSTPSHQLPPIHATMDSERLSLTSVSTTAATCSCCADWPGRV